MNDPIRICKNCEKPKALNSDNFAPRATREHGMPGFRPTCRDCVRTQDRKRPPRDYAAEHKSRQRKQRPTAQSSRMCADCHNMSWCRPIDKRCTCGGVHAPEPKVELVTHKHFERAV